MAQATPATPSLSAAPASWEKPTSSRSAALRSTSTGRWKFLVGGLLILGAVAYLVISGTLSGARYYITVEELVRQPQYAGQTVRVSGAVLGETIQYDAENLLINFTVASIPENTGNIGEALHTAVNDPNATLMQVHVEGQVKPELLQHEAQAIMSGHLDENGVFQVSELQTKCPSRFVENGVDQSIVGQENVEALPPPLPSTGA